MSDTDEVVGCHQLVMHQNAMHTCTQQCRKSIFKSRHTDTDDTDDTEGYKRNLREKELFLLNNTRD